MKATKTFLTALSLLTLVTVFGCGGSTDLDQVSGTVTYNGQPLEGATVSFLPDSSDGILAVGTTDTNGQYILAAPLKKGTGQGAFAGKYKVTIAKKEADPDPNEQLYQRGEITYSEYQSRRAKGGSRPVRNLIPARYGNARQSDLTAEVLAKTKNEFNFDLVD